MTKGALTTNWLPATAFLLLSLSTLAQTTIQTAPASPQTSPQLPDAPSAVQSPAHSVQVVTAAEASFKANGDGPHTCSLVSATKVIYFNPNHFDEAQKPCVELIYPYQRFLNSNIAIPLTWQQKGYLALHDLTDPANFGTILGISAITIAADSNSAYGSGFEGFGKLVGVSLLQDATGQFFGVFAIPSLVHQDPRYYRMPHAKVGRRILYSVSRTFIARSDSGRSMPNYATLLTYPINTALSNLYVPGIDSSASSSTVRTVTGIAIDPANNLLTEFLPDVASHVHIRVIFVQTLLNNIASGATGVTLQ